MTIPIFELRGFRTRWIVSCQRLPYLTALHTYKEVWRLFTCRTYKSECACLLAALQMLTCLVRGMTSSLDLAGCFILGSQKYRYLSRC